MQVIAGFTVDNDTKTFMMLEPPASKGYYTNIQFNVFVQLTMGQFRDNTPAMVYFGSKLQDAQILPIATGSVQKVNAKNGVLFPVWKLQDVVDPEEDFDGFHYTYFTKKRVYVHDSQPTMLSIDMHSTGTICTVFMVADFVPYPGAEYKQQERKTGIENLTDWSIMKPVMQDLRSAVLTVDYYVENSTAYVGELVVKKYNPRLGLEPHNMANIEYGSAYPKDIGEDNFAVSSALVGSIPITSLNSNSAGTKKLALGDIESGDQFIVTLESKLGISAPTDLDVSFTVSGIIAYSKGETYVKAKFVNGSSVINLNDEELNIFG
jgi:hypothetical protein